MMSVNQAMINEMISMMLNNMDRTEVLCCMSSVISSPHSSVIWFVLAHAIATGMVVNKMLVYMGRVPVMDRMPIMAYGVMSSNQNVAFNLLLSLRRLAVDISPIGMAVIRTLHRICLLASHPVASERMIALINPTDDSMPLSNLNLLKMILPVKKMIRNTDRAIMIVGHSIVPYFHKRYEMVAGIGIPIIDTDHR